ncbi:MAG: uracil-DNA glycosylase [Deltaproteobacteria bacterium]|nr:uracil-DNA glycosylase [Deltaproteobacteria bacterium]
MPTDPQQGRETAPIIRPSSRSPNLEPSWMAVMGDVFDEEYMRELRAFLVEEKQKYTVYPPGKDIFNAFWYTPFDQVRVVILGQDPYHGPGQAHGLCFSVQPHVPPPPSLQNIFKEIHDDLGIGIPDHGYLVHWARQGVLLLNAVLTVRAGSPQSHAGQGWEAFTDRAIAELNRRRSDLVFALWGSPAQKKAAAVDRSRHLVLTAPHPSPLSAHRGFLGCRHFSQINRWLTEHGQPPIDWGLPPKTTPLG